MPSSNNITVEFEDSGTPLKRSKNRRGETCEEQLRRMCKNIAEEITKGTREVPDGESPASEYMEHVYDIRYIVDREKRYYSAELLVAGGGPTIWVSLNDMEVQGYWGSDRVNEPFIDNIGLDDYLEEMYGC
tara:strand:- start:663 stop:1055 length:393 start_codon:yes stop_codon:yes gene_type:complete